MNIRNYMKQNWRELGIGGVVGLLSFLALRGYNVLPVLLISGLIAMVLFVSRKGNIGGKSTSWGGHDGDRKSSQLSFSQIGGQNKAVEEVKEALDLMVDEDRVSELGIRSLRGLLLAGPPGTGKTMLARAAAGYIGSCFVSASGSEFVEMYAGVGAQRIRELFSTARKKATKQNKKAALVFVDELEIIGGKRGRHSSHLEYDQTLNQLLIEMDGISRDEGPKILVMGATNRRDLLDDALLRPGRFDRIVQVDLPDFEGRKEILQLYLENKPLDDSVELETLGRATFGFSGAQLESLTNEAAIMAFREDSQTITQKHLRESVEKVIMGEKIDRRPPQNQLERVAIHELGHALIGELVDPGSVASLTIAPRGGSLGYVRRAHHEDRFLYTASELTAEIDFSLGGCAAERLFLGQGSTGVSGDFQKASNLAKRLVTSGMTRMGIVSEETLSPGDMNKIVSEILNSEIQKVTSVLTNSGEFFDAARDVLMEKETISGKKVRGILEQCSISLGSVGMEGAPWRPTDDESVLTGN